ncbi:MAG: DUF523 domain-containing protein [Sulfurospirillaceae bacterium]|nr:DUF523 domain-containing protein [Sulfurospirillaceae bacterium]
MSRKVLISACLMGENVKYDGGNNYIEDSILNAWEKSGFLVSVCPEVIGGLEVPRMPCEVVFGTHKVVNKNGEDKTVFFERGAFETLKIAKENGVKIAILKARSPSCGKKVIYDGSFSGTKIDDSGVTCKLLEANGIAVFTEKEIEEAQKYLEIIN